MKVATKKTATKFWVAFTIALMTGFAAFGQDSQQPAASTPLSAMPGKPTADQIIDRYQQAVGGRASWQKLTSRSSMGTVEVPSMNLSGTVVIHEKAPDKIVTVIIMAGSVFRQGFDGSAGWAEAFPRKTCVSRRALKSRKPNASPISTAPSICMSTTPDS